MIEVERKYRLTRKQFRELLEDFVSKSDSVFPVEQRDTVYLLGATSFADFQPGSPVVRIRKIGETCTLTAKRRINPEGDANELETQIVSHSQMNEILLLAGFNVVSTVTKTRVEFIRDSVTVAFDDVASIGLFVEFEILTDQNGSGAAVKTIEALAFSLGLSTDEVETLKYDQLAAAAIGNHK